MDTQTRPDAQEDERGKELAEQSSALGHKAPSDESVQDGIDQAEAFANDPANSTGGSGASSPGSSSGGRGGFGSRVAGAFKGAGQFAGRHKKGVAGAGGAGLIVTFIIISFTALLPLKLINIAENLAHFHFKVEENTEKKITNKLLSKLSPYDAEGRNKIKGKGFFGNKWANFRVDKFDARLAAKGIKMNIDPKTHQLVSITRNGVTEDVSKSKLAQASEVIKIVNEEIPPWRIAKRIKFTKLMTVRYGVSFKYFAKQKFKSTKDFLVDRATKTRNGASSTEIDAATNRDTPIAEDNAAATNATDQKTSPGNKQAEKSGSQIVNDVTNEFNKTGDVKAAIKAGSRRIASNKTLGFVGVAALICSVKSLADEAVSRGYIQRAYELMRMGGAILSMADGLKNGKNVDPGTLNMTMQLFEPDPNAKPVKVQGKDQPSEDSKDFTQAAEWQRATNQKVTGPEMNGAANPNAKNGLASAIGVIDQVFNDIPGGKLVCKATTGIFGMIASGVELLANVFDGGIEEAAGTAFKLGLQTVLMVKVIPDLLAGAAGLAVTGTENAVGQINLGGAGLALMSADYGRSFGSMPVSDATHGKLSMEADASNTADNRQKGLAYNLFSTDNPSSAVSNLIMRTPNSPQQAFASLSATLSNLPGKFAGAILGVIQPSRAADNTYTNPNQFQNYDFTDAELNAYDINFLANYFEAPVATVNGQPVARIDVIGDPNGFNFGDTDTNNHDMLHCFVNPFVNPESQQGEDPVCKNIGYLTQGDTPPTPSDAEWQQDIQSNVYDYFCGVALKGQACPFKAASDELLRYRLYLAYQHVGSAIYDTTVDSN